MSQRFFNPAPQFFDSGTPAAPLSGGLMYFYRPGNDTPKDTYSDSDLTVPNSNPVVLSASGVLPNVFLSGAYRVVLQDKNGVQQPGWPRDAVNSVASLAYSAWDSTVTYGVGATNIVYASNGDYYVSIQASNTNHEPSASPLWWQPAIDYFLTSQTVVAPGYVAVGDATTGLTGISMVTKGGILAGDGTTAPQVLTVGTNGQYLSAQSGQTTGLQWVSPPSAITNVQEFPGSGTWTKPAGCTSVLVEQWAGGGGGRGSASGSSGGGGGGGFVIVLLDAADCAATEAVTIGAGGVGGAAADGGDGGDTTFGSLVTARGGRKGTNGGGDSGDYTSAGGTNLNAWSSGAGGSTTGGGATGLPGGSCIMGGGGGGAGGSATQGAGGTSLNGGGGGDGRTTAGAALAGTTPGGGGGGAYNGTGGAGGNGYMRVTSW